MMRSGHDQVGLNQFVDSAGDVPGVMPFVELAIVAVSEPHAASGCW